MKLQLFEEKVLRAALRIAEKRMTYGALLTDPYKVRDYLKLWAANQGDQEHFGIIWLTTKHGIIGTDIMFHGTVDSSSVFPRPVVAKALEREAGACILFHNHPSGYSEPSNADPSNGSDSLFAHTRAVGRQSI
jgi:DNA repair protein RadC